jgi:hypothetical protein
MGGEGARGRGGEGARGRGGEGALGGEGARGRVTRVSKVQSAYVSE